MAIETLLGYRAVDSTESINARLSGLVPAGIIRGGLVQPEPASLQIRIVGDEGDDVVLIAFGPDGMMVREKSEQRVLAVTAGVTNIIALRIKYVESGDAIAEYEVLSEGEYLADPEIKNLVRLAAVIVPNGATAVTAEMINLSFRDSVEGFNRPTIRGVVESVEDLPAASGFPATAEINLIGNTFATGTYVQLDTTSVVQYPFVPPINFSLASASEPGLSRVNPSQKAVVSAVQDSLTGTVTLQLASPHGILPGSVIRLTDVSAPQANQTWTVASTPTASTITFAAPLLVAWSGTGGSMVDTSVAAIVTARTAPGVTHSLVPSQQITISGASDPTFNGLFTITTIINSQIFQYQQSGFASRDSGNGIVSKVGFSLPGNAVEIGETAAATSQNFAEAIRSSVLDADIKVIVIGSSLELQAKAIGTEGNSYTLLKVEPGVSTVNQQIVLSGTNFTGGVEPSQTASSSADLRAGDSYIVLTGESGTPELWTFDGSIFRNLTSAATGTLLDFHRRNLLLNEKHLTENEKAALVGTVGTPSAANPFVTAQDTSVLTVALAAALQGADGTPPSGSNRFLTEARIRGQRSDIAIPALQNFVELPLGERWIIGESNAATTSALSIPYFNVVQTSSLLDAGGPTEYAQSDFAPVIVEGLYVDSGLTTELNPSIHADTNGIYPRADSALLSLPTQLFVKLSAVPLNGSASLLYSEAVAEKNRKPSADMLATPQRIQSSSLSDLQNKVAELRYNAGISFSGKSITFPANMFTASNVQGFVLSRTTGTGHPITLTSSFTVNLQSGLGSLGLVNPFTSASFAGPTLNQWTRFLLAVDPDGNSVSVYPVFALLEKSTDLAFASTLSGVAKPTLALNDGSLPFAIVGVKSDGVTGNTILDIDPTSLELLPYETGRESGSTIVCGDGVSSFGHFTGQDAIERALYWAAEGSTIQVEPGLYNGPFTVSTPNIKIQGSTAAQITGGSDFCIRVNAEGVQLKDLRLLSAPTAALDIQPGANRLCLENLLFEEASIGMRIKPPAIKSFGPVDVDLGTDVITIPGGHGYLTGAKVQVTTSGTLPAGLSLLTDYYINVLSPTTLQLTASPNGSAINITTTGTGIQTLNAGGRVYDLRTSEQDDDGVTITVTDGSGGRYLGLFNSPDGIQLAQDIALSGQTLVIYPGVYNRVSVTGSRLTFKGVKSSGGETRINAQGGTNVCLTVSGSFNVFENLFLENGAAGISVIAGGNHNVFADSVLFAATIGTGVRFPNTLSEKHYNYHASVSGNITTGSGQSVQQNPTVTVGDGLSSWGDYNGQDALNLALALEAQGTEIIVRRGTFNAIATGGSYTGMNIRGAGGNRTIIQANALGGDIQAVQVVGSFNRFSGLFLLANGNDNPSINYKTYGIRVTGNGNTFQDIEFQETGITRIESAYRYSVTSGFRNRFIPHVGMPSGSFASYTVGDGRVSFGDYNGSNGIIAAIQASATTPRGSQASLVAGVPGFATFSDDSPSSPFQFSTRDLHQFLNITATTNSVNLGTFEIVAVLTSNSVTLRRYDGALFADESGVFWDFIAGQKFEILPGSYEPFTIPVTRNNIEINAWEGAVVVGDTVDSPIISVLGANVVIRGLRISGGVPVTGVGISVTGRGFRAERLRIETPVKYFIDPAAGGGEFYDGIEAKDREVITTSILPSRADFVGSNHLSIQAAIDAAAADGQVKTVFLGNGTYIVSATITVPANITIRGSGYGTHLLGTGAFPAFTLDAGGNQTVSGIRFTDFTFSLSGPASGVFAYGNWLEDAPINGNVTGSTASNLTI